MTEYNKQQIAEIAHDATSRPIEQLLEARSTTSEQLNGISNDPNLYRLIGELTSYLSQINFEISCRHALDSGDSVIAEAEALISTVES